LETAIQQTGSLRYYQLQVATCSFAGIMTSMASNLQPTHSNFAATSPVPLNLESAWDAANQGSRIPTVLIFSGIGSLVYGKKSSRGAPVKLGGWGPLLGDKGSAYEIGLRGLKASLYRYDQDGRWPALGARLLKTLRLNSPTELIGWARAADPSQIAALAAPVFRAWKAGDKIATDIISAAARSLAADGLACARRSAGPQGPVKFVLSGNLLLKEPRFAARISRLLRQKRPQAGVSTFDLETVASAFRPEQPETTMGSIPISSLRLSPTEQRHSRSMGWDEQPLRSAIRLMLSEDAKIPAKLLSQTAVIEQALKAIIRSFRAGGRLFYVGAGTSGRLGVLDASECPPTFRSPPEMVQGIIAGGPPALSRSIEGAEDDANAGAEAIAFRGITQRDVVLGIAASGTTPFVWGALRMARLRRATTVLLCFNPWLDIPKEWRPDVLIAPNLGPELLTGSTRLKAGTATKLILNILTTLAMMHTGKVISNLMVDLRPSNTKLRHRAARIVQQLTGMDAAAARAALIRHGWRIKKAVAVRGRKRGPRVGRTFRARTRRS
jgi:N-acetylmuramic acid 6-phosphate etherase